MLGKKTILLLIALIGLILVGCGGGGTNNNSSDIISQITVKIPDTREVSATIGQANISFPENCFGGQAEVQVTETKATKIPQPNFQSIQPTISFGCSAEPIKPFIVSYPDIAGGIPIAVILNGKTPIGAFAGERKNGRIVIEIDPTVITARQADSRGWSLVVTIMVGIVNNYSPPDENFGLVLMETNQNGQGSVIFVHGLFQSIDGTSGGLHQAMLSGNYKYGYAYAYNYEGSFKNAGNKLAKAIAAKGFGDKSVDIIGYSKGGLISLWAAVRCEQTRPIRNIIFTGSPFEGCNSILKYAYSRLCESAFLSIDKLWFFDIDDNVFEELISGSDSLRELMSTQPAQRGDVNYYLFGGDKDVIVSQDSARAESSDLNTLTSGLVTRNTLSGFGHFDMDDPEAIKQAYETIAANDAGNLTITFSPPEARVDTVIGAWRATITLTNNTGKTIRTTGLKLEEYGRYGDWQGDYWFDPDYQTGTFYPYVYVDLSDKLSPITPGSNYITTIQFWPDELRTPIWDAPEALQARTAKVIWQATDQDGKVYKTSKVLVMPYNGIYPSSPSTRAPKGPSQKGNIEPAR